MTETFLSPNHSQIIADFRQGLFSFENLAPHDKWTKENVFLMKAVKINNQEVVDLVFEYAAGQGGQVVDRHQKDMGRRYFSFLCQTKKPFAPELALYALEKLGKLPSDILRNVVSGPLGREDTLKALLPKFSQVEKEEAFAALLFSEYPSQTAFYILYDTLSLQRLQDFYLIIMEDKAIYKTLNSLVSLFLEKAKADIDRGFLIQGLEDTSKENSGTFSGPRRTRMI